MVSIDRSVGWDYVSKLRSFLSHFNDSTLTTCQQLMELMSGRFYAMSKDQIAQIMFHYVCFGIDKLPDFRVLHIIRECFIFFQFSPVGLGGGAETSDF